MTESDEQFAHLPSGLDLCYSTYGDPGDPAVLLVMGLGGPMGWWSPDFCRALSRRGYFVLRYDNRDTGRSTKLRQHRVTRLDIVRAAIGRGRAPYGIGDLAEDAVGLLDHLGIERAHLVGVSMGGMIAQTIAIRWPQRTLSLTSIMSTTGRRTVGFQHPKVLPGLLAPGGRTRESYLEGSLRTTRMIGSPAYPPDERKARARAEETYDRGWVASGVARHILAVLTQPDRTAQLAQLDLPVTVVHGLADPLVHVSGGRATAKAVPGAELIEVPGMAHDLPPELDETFIEAIVSTAERAAN